MTFTVQFLALLETNFKIRGRQWGYVVLEVFVPISLALFLGLFIIPLLHGLKQTAVTFRSAAEKEMLQRLSSVSNEHGLAWSESSARNPAEHLHQKQDQQSRYEIHFENILFLIYEIAGSRSPSTRADNGRKNFSQDDNEQVISTFTRRTQECQPFNSCRVLQYPKGLANRI